MIMLFETASVFGYYLEPEFLDFLTNDRKRISACVDTIGIIDYDEHRRIGRIMGYNLFGKLSEPTSYSSFTHMAIEKRNKILDTDYITVFYGIIFKKVQNINTSEKSYGTVVKSTLNEVMDLFPTGIYIDASIVDNLPWI